MNESLQNIITQANLSQYQNSAITIFIIILITATLNFFAKKIIHKLEISSKNSDTIWDDNAIHAMRRPIHLFIWIIGLTISANIAFSNSSSDIKDAISTIRHVGITISITYAILRFINCTEKSFKNNIHKSNKKIDQTTLTTIASLLRASLIITAILMIMQSLGFSISGILAFGGIGGMAVALAAKDMLANFFGAIMIYLDKPFKVGDWILSPDREIEGTVEEIGWRRTCIRTFDKRPLYVPNSVFTSIAVENPSRMSNRRIYEYFGVRYDDMEQLNNITMQVEAMLRNHQDIDSTQTLMVHLDKFSPSSVDFFIYSFTKTTDWITFHAIKQQIMLKIADIITSNNAECAYPTTTIHLSDTTKQSQ